jgi:hypothetical protein
MISLVSTTLGNGSQLAWTFSTPKRGLQFRRLCAVNYRPR